VSRCDGSLADFLVARDSFANGLACFACFYAAFNARHFSLPGVFFDERHRMYIPGFIAGIAEGANSPMPITDQIKTAFPPFVLRGAVATTWHIVANVLFEKREVIRVFLTAILPQDNAAAVVPVFMERARALGGRAPVGNPGYDSCFPFDVFEHLVETANNSMHAQHLYFAWI
jgi:hypothetical protein